MTPKQVQLRGHSPLPIVRNYLAILRHEFHDQPKQFADLVDEQYDVINIHEWPANRAALFLKKRWPNVPIVWMCNDVWHLPSGGTLVSSEEPFKVRAQKWLLLIPHLLLDRRATRNMQHVVVLDHRIKNIVFAYYRVPTSVIRSGVNSEQLLSYRDDSSRLKIFRRHGLEDSSFLLVCASIFFPHRRFEDVIEAVSILQSRYPQLRLAIVGSTKFDTGYAAKIVQLIAQHQLQKIVTQVTDFLPDRELYEYYQAADVFVFPNFNQTWGLAPIEAMVLGKPVAVSTGAGVHEIITDQSTGLLFPPKHPAELAKVIAWYIDHPAERASIARAGHEYALRTFSWNKYAEQMLEVLNSIKSQ